MSQVFLDENDDFQTLMPISVDLGVERRMYQTVSPIRSVKQTSIQFIQQPLQGLLRKLETVKFLQTKITRDTNLSPVRVRIFSPVDKKSSMSVKQYLKSKRESDDSIQFQPYQHKYVITKKSLPNTTYHSSKFRKLHSKAIRKSEAILSSNKNCSPKKIDLALNKSHIKQPKYKLYNQFRYKKTFKTKNNPQIFQKQRCIKYLATNQVFKKTSPTKFNLCKIK